MVGLPADSYGMFEFYRSEEILEAGRAATRAALERLETDGENGMVFAESEGKDCDGPFLKNSKVVTQLHTDFRAIAMYSGMKEMAENISGFLTGQR